MPRRTAAGIGLLTHIHKVEVINLKAEILRLLREDEEFRLAVMGLLGYTDLKSSVDRLTEAVKELTSQIGELTKTVKSHEERLAKVEERVAGVEDRLARLEKAAEELAKAVKSHDALLEELAKIIKSHDERLERLERAVRLNSEKLESLDRKLTALGARWGAESEEAFRNAMRGVVQDILGVATVDRWIYFDREGVVYGHPSAVEIDIAVKDGVHILVEVKASASSGDAAELHRMGKLYESTTGIKPRLVLITPFIDDKALEKAKALGIEVYTST